ncbi:Hexaprenyldihydroxybenzoate methyltransferase, mitochondrial [Diatrype stigma]|uniref:Ubiquinone biosynthesis O-methyltransferase, mitochondrial n=1 Tax=Diatrype stigma TaxID=117547 RepID=A0AAN9UJV3_9PEZI
MASRPNAALLFRRLRGISASSTPMRRIAAVTTISPSRSFSGSPQNRTQQTPSPPPHPDANPNPAAEHPAFTTVSPDEISHFNNLASSWWDPQGPSRILHLMNPLRHDFIRSCRSSVPHAGTHNSQDDQPTSSATTKTGGGGLRYLDIGCGGGIFAESAARLPDTASVTAIDPSPEVIAVARAHARRDPLLLAPRRQGGGAKLEYINTSVEQLAVPRAASEAYDVVSVFEVLEHVASPAAFLDRCAPLVRPGGGGWLVLSTIARTWTSWLTTNVMAEDVLRIVPRGTHDWRKYVNPDELRRHFLPAGEDKRPGPGGCVWADPVCMGVVYVPGFGWKAVPGSEEFGNYFFAVRRVD